MAKPLNRAQRCRDLAEKCRAIAAICDPSTEMQTHYSLMSEDSFAVLAEVEKWGALA